MVVVFSCWILSDIDDEIHGNLRNICLFKIHIYTPSTLISRNLRAKQKCKLAIFNLKFIENKLNYCVFASKSYNFFKFLIAMVIVFVIYIKFFIFYEISK